MDLLSFITNERLSFLIKELIDNSMKKNFEIDHNMKKNVMDPFSTMFECLIFGFGYDEWFRKEKTRQVQKSMQNMVGEFHQKCLVVFQDGLILKRGMLLI